MNEKGLKPYMYTGLSYNHWRDVVPERKREWDGYIIPQLEMKKPIQYPELPSSVKSAAAVKMAGPMYGTGFAEMIYTYDLQDMASFYPNSREEYYPPAETPFDYIPPVSDEPVSDEPEPSPGPPPVPQEQEGHGDRYTVLLLHMNGPYSMTTFKDSSPRKHTITTGGTGTPRHDPSKKVFGRSSGNFDDSIYSAYLSAPASTVPSCGTLNYTIDFWLNTTHSTSVGGANMIPIYQGDSNGTPSTISHIFQIGIVIANRLSWSPNYKSYPSHTWLTTGPVNDGLWHHIAAVRAGDNFHLFMDGYQLAGTLTLPGYSQAASTQPFFMGKQNSTYHQFAGWLDEVHFSLGIARWTSNFNPPSKPW